MKISVIFDNLASEGFVPAWGLSIFVELPSGERILFDTGSSCKVWEKNATRLGINFDSFDFVFLSHFHWDHVGSALDAAFASKKKKHFLITEGFSKAFASEIARNGHTVFLVREPYRFSENLFSLGAMETGIGNLYEHSLIAFFDGEYLLFVGCSHPGILRIVSRAVELTGKPPYLVIGGFHLLGESELNIPLIAEEMLNAGVKYVAPCHCTGERGREIFASVFGNRFIDVRAGTILEF